MSRTERFNWRLTIQLVLPFVLFLALAGDNLFEFFGGDDAMNLYNYSVHPLSHWAAGLLHFWSSDWYRPLGGILYLILFRLFGLHPLPFKILLFALILSNMALFVRIAASLVQRDARARTPEVQRQIAALALLLCAYHAALDGLYLDFGTIFDVLGYLFFFSALAIYAGWVTTSRRPFAGPLLVLVFYIGGLCSKEIVVTLPCVLLAYNLLLTDSLARDRWRWPVRSGLAIVLCSAIAAVYTLGKMTGPGSLTREALYSPRFTLHQYGLVTASYIRQLFYLSPRFLTPTGAIWILAMMAIVGLLLRSRLMLFCVIAIVLVQLPVSFITPRGAFAIYIAVSFWALYAALLIYAIVPRIQRPAWSFAVYVVLAVALTAIHARMKPQRDRQYTVQTKAYRTFVDQLAQWNFRLPPTGNVVLLNDPFPADWIGYDSLFLISLYANTTHASASRVKFDSVMVPQSEIDACDYVIDYDSGWRLLKAPGRQFTDSARVRELAAQRPVVLLDSYQQPSPDGWRITHPPFSMQVKAAREMRPLDVFLSTWTPAKITASVDGNVISSQAAEKPGDLRFRLPIPGGGDQAHKVRFDVSPNGGGNPTVLFLRAEITSP